MAKKGKTDFKYNLRMYFSFLNKYRFLFVTILFAILVVEGLNVFDKYLFKLLVDNGTDYAAGKINLDQITKFLIELLLAFIALIILRGTGRWIRMHLISKVEVKMMQDLKIKFFNHLISLSHDFHITHKTGSLISKLIRGSSAIERMTDGIVFNFVPTFFQIIIAGSSLFYFDITSAIITILVIVLFFGYSIFIQNLQKDANTKSNNAEDLEKANVSDFFTNIDSIKHFGKENFIKNKFQNISVFTRKLVLKFWNYSRWSDSVQATIIAVGTIFIIYFPLMKFLNNELSLGSLVFIYTVYSGLVGYLYNLVHGIRDYYRVMTDFESLFKYYKIENEVKDIENAEDLIIKKGSVEFSNVSFSYNKKKIFNNFNLKINENEKVALVGPSGSGKTTLIKLLYRLYDLNKGKILIDDIDIKEVKQESLRSELSIVPQECVLFDDTVYNNILFSNPKASKKQVFDAMKFAQLDKVVKNFPKKEKTIVGERGVKLSGGEKQRVSIARAILADKKILVLDEATSSLDSETEHEIQKDLINLMEKRTSIIIAHRLSTIMHADKIVVLDNGKIVQIGKHNELINQEGLYKRLWGLQKGGYIK